MSPTKLEKLAIFNKHKERLFTRIQITYDMIAHLPNNRDIFIARASDLRDTFKEFDTVVNQINELNAQVEVGDQIDVQAAALSFEELYYAIKAKYEQIIKDIAKEESQESVSSETPGMLKPKLPLIHIPPFKGDYEKFPSFISLFNSLVHNQNFSPIVKFSYLKSLLLFPATQTLDSVEFTSENYEEAYNKLITRYSNKRIVASYHLNKILSFKPFSVDNAHNFRAFLDTFDDNFNALKALGLNNLSDFLMVHLGLKVIDKDTRRLFENRYTDQQLPTFEELSQFIKAQLRVAELCTDSSSKGIGATSKINTKEATFSKARKSQSFLSKATHINNSQSSHDKSNVQCPFCKSSHKIISCPQFLNADIDGRYAMLKKFTRCFSCTGPHKLTFCDSKGSCQICGSKKHNTLLHKGMNSSSNRVDIDTSPHTSTASAVPTTKEVKSVNSLNTAQAMSCHSVEDTQVLLGTASAKIKAADGEWYTCRLLIDPGSQVNFITNSLANRLGLSRKRSNISVSGVGETSLPVSQIKVDCIITPNNSDDNIFYEFSARVLPSIITSSPMVPVAAVVQQRFAHISLSDPEFYKPGRIDLLLGAQIYSEILSDPPSLIKGNPSAILTSLGWIIFGEAPLESPQPVSVTSFFTYTALHDQLQRFWESEEVSVSLPANPEDSYCEEHFSKTVSRDELGRYVVSLPFRPNVPIELGSTREIAHQRFSKLENRFSKNLAYKEQYVAQMNDYIESDHIREAEHSAEYIITHHGVSKESTSTQLRVVFNGSEHAPGFPSLNDFLLTGPQLQTDIGKLIDNFRTYPVALTCDVKQMFRCIRLNEADRKYIHFIWRPDSSQPIKEFELTTLPFGLRCSPYEAMRVLVQLFKDEGHKFPKTSNCINEIYVDNIVSGAHNVEEALELYEQLISLFATGGFALRKFSSNNTRVLETIPAEWHEQPLLLDDSLNIKVLGLQWNPKTDSLCYTINLSNTPFTKRGILSLAARIFDINGYLSPVTFWVKVLLQRLWLLHIDWDDELPNDIQVSWTSFLDELPLLQEISIPRYFLTNNIYSFQLISFADASEKGFGCVVYLRTITTSGSIQINLLRAKSKVAPLKVISIPRLELNAALLLAKVINSLSDLIQKFNIKNVYCFSDSKNVLYWLQTPPHLLKIYVANRVVQILEVTHSSCWSYIPSKSNPADCISRGLTPKQLLTFNLYWDGPEFVYLPQSEWPIYPIEHKHSEILELKSLTSIETSSDYLDYLTKFSSLITLQRVLAYVLRFIHSRKTLSTLNNNSINLSAHELNSSLLIYIKYTQRKFFPELIKCLETNKLYKGSLQNLSPFIDSHGFLRVGGRIKNAPIPESTKHPLLIPKNSHLAVLLCDYYHKYSLHGGPLLVQSLIHRKYWIPSLRNLLRKRIFRCACYKTKLKPQLPLMGNLPSFRLSEARPFQRVGVDYAGPFQLKLSRKRNASKSKCWIALFVCMVTKAVHLELVTDLTTESFIATLDRFIARRGLPKCIYSDRGTNFVGAARKLKDFYEFLFHNSDVINNHLTQSEIDWNFIPPASPHFGGLWEAAIKSAKRHLLIVTQDHALPFEEFYTLLTRIEAVLNSRPLCSLSNDPSDNLDYLTPGHFLIGAPLLARPEDEEIQLFPLNSRWELISRSVRHFWKRWYHEYLHTLIPKKKWSLNQENLKEGTLVILHEPVTRPQEWKMARVMEVVPGADGVVRVVKLRTSHNTLVRPVHKVAPLPCGTDFY